MPARRRHPPARPTTAEPARPAPHARSLNLERVLTIAMDRAGPFTRSEIIQATGLSAPTVGSLTCALIRRGVIRDLGAGPSRGGRRPAHMEFNAQYGFVAGIDIGPTRTRLAIADLRGDLVIHRVVPTPAPSGAAEALAQLAAEVHEMLAEAHVRPDRLLAVAAGAPGVVDPAHGTFVAPAPNVLGWSSVPMARVLREALGAPVTVENDVNLAILGERWRGAARGHDSCAFITIGTGIGAGIVINGELHHGHHFLAGEIGLMCMGPQYLATDVHGRGCLETLAGLRALAARWPAPAGSDGKGWETALFEAVAAGDEHARALVRDTAMLLGIATANLSVVLDPSIIVLGGALVAGGDALVEEVRRIVARIVPIPSPIVVSALGKEAPLWGSLLVALTNARARVRQQLSGGETEPAG